MGVSKNSGTSTVLLPRRRPMYLGYPISHFGVMIPAMLANAAPIDSKNHNMFLVVMITYAMVKNSVKMST